MEKQLYFGLILSNHEFATPEGTYFLSAEEAVANARSHPYAPAREREGQYVALRAVVHGGVMLGCSIVEAAPPITSQLLARLLEQESGLRGQVLGLVREVRDELVGKPEPVDEVETPLSVAPSGPLPLCVLDIGHHPDAPGACGVLGGVKCCEFRFNEELAKMILPLVKEARVSVMHRESGSAAGYRALPAKVNAMEPNFVISLHANGNGSTAHGSEVLYYDGSTEGRKLATLLQREFLKELGLRDRGLKPRTAAERGGSQLAGTRATIVIGEPFFITNAAEFAAVSGKKAALARAYATAIDAYAVTLSNPPVTLTSGREPASQVEPGAKFTFVTDNLTKDEFLQRNDAELEKLIAAVNVRLQGGYGANCTRLTREDVWVLTYCEAGLRDGKVDPDHRHSEGERGMLPLPKNVRDWNGPDAPVWDRPMPVARNLEHFYLYLGHLKNKDLTGAPRHLYGGLFKIKGIAGHAARQAKVLAGAVHGYFYSPNYRPGPAPYEHLVHCYQTDVPLAKMMETTTYVHAGTSVMTGRERNIEVALQLV